MSDILETGRRTAERMRDVLLPIIQKVPREHQGLLIALLERNAARRYRAWVEEAASDDEKRGLEACATREEEVATRIEALTPNPQEIQKTFGRYFPELKAAYESVFGGKDRREQMAIQAAAERGGAGVWRALAAAGGDERSRPTLEACALLEEESAEYLETLLGGK